MEKEGRGGEEADAQGILEWMATRVPEALSRWELRDSVGLAHLSTQLRGEEAGLFVLHLPLAILRAAPGTLMPCPSAAGHQGKTPGGE